MDILRNVPPSLGKIRECFFLKNIFLSALNVESGRAANIVTKVFNPVHSVC